MVAHIKTVAFLGVDAVSVDVKAQLAPGHNTFTVVGLPDKSVAESRERARAAQMGPQNCLNEHLEGEALYKLAAPGSAGQNLLDRIADTKKLSARGFNRILRVARTLADLDHRDAPSAENIATAIRWRGITV